MARVDLDLGQTPFAVRSVAHRALPEVIAEQIVEAIRVTPLQPGERLPPETELARLLGVGRTSVREALQKLQTLGIVEVVRGRGAFVAEPKAQDGEVAFAKWIAEHAFAIEDLIETRIALECSAAALAAVRASDAQITALQETNAEHIQAGQDNELSQVFASDQTFHELIVAASGNPLLAKIYGTLIPELTSFRQKTLSVPGVPERSAVAHASIVEAIASRDPRRARAAMIDHLWTLYEDVELAARRGQFVRRSEKKAAPVEALA